MRDDTRALVLTSVRLLIAERTSQCHRSRILHGLINYSIEVYRSLGSGVRGALFNRSGGELWELLLVGNPFVVGPTTPLSVS